MVAVGVADPIIDDPIVVLFDEGHGQFYNRSLYSKAISDLRISKSMKVVFNNGAINSTSFEGVDIFVSTNPQVAFSFAESKYTNRFISRGKAIFLLANPLDEDNETLNGRGNIFNDFIGSLKLGFIMGNFWTYKEGVDSNQANIVFNDFSNAGDPAYLHLELNRSSHEILNIDKNITSVVTYTCSIEEPSQALQKVMIAPPEAYTKTISGEFRPDPSDILLMSSAEDDLDTGARIVLGGSSIMFSDSYDPILQSSWYESENNSYLWLNIFEWLAAANPETQTSPSILPEVLLQVFLLFVGVSIIFLVGGSLTYSIGSGRKISLIKSGQEVETPTTVVVDKDIEPSIVQPGTSSKESRRDRRLRQIKKHQRQRRK